MWTNSFLRSTLSRFGSRPSPVVEGVGTKLARIAAETALAARAYLDRLPSHVAPAAADGTAPASTLANRCVETGRPVPATQGGYVRTLRREPLIAAAAREGAVIRLMVRPGHFVAAGTALAHVWPAERHAALAPEVGRAIAIGRDRVLAEDPELGVLRLVEPALHGLGPIGNDLSTTMACIDWLGAAVAAFVSLPETDGAWRDPAGKIRVLEPPLRFERVVKAAFDQIRQGATGNVAVTIRLLQTFARLGPLLQTEAQRAAVRAQAEAIREVMARSGFARSDMGDVVSAHARAKAALDVAAAE
jgi:uncharacterized membrane protein